MQSALTPKMYSSSLLEHVPATHLNVQERDTAHKTFYIHYLKQVVSTALLHTCSCPFIYSTLINVKNQFGPGVLWLPRLLINPLMNMEPFGPRWLFLPCRE